MTARHGADWCKSRALDCVVTFMSGQVVCLAKGGGGKICLACEALGAVAFRGAVIAATVCAGI